MTLRYECAFSHAGYTVWIIYPMPRRVRSGAPIQRFRDYADTIGEPSQDAKHEIKSWYASVCGTDARHIRFTPFR